MEIVNHIQEAQRVPYNIKPRRNMPRHMLIKLIKNKHKERILKAARKKQQVTYKGNTICLTADLSAEILQERRECQNMFKVLKGKHLQPRLLYPARISFKIDGEIKSFSDKQELREFNTTKPAIQQMLNRLIQSRNTRKRDLQNQSQTIQKMAIGTYISIITLNVNGLNASTKRHRLAEWIQKEDPYICCLQETHFRPQDTYRLKVKGWNNIPSKWEAKESWSSNPHIRHNSP